MVLYITANGKSDTYGCCEAFALMYRRANWTFYEFIKLYPFVMSKSRTAESAEDAEKII
jgi:hypothetical protein